MVFRFSSSKTLVFMCVRLILRLILRVLGLGRKNIGEMSSCKKIISNKNKNCAVDNCIESLSLSNRKGKRPNHDDKSSCDAASESSGDRVEKFRKFRSSRKKRFIRRGYLQDALSLTPPQARRHSLSSGISTGSDTIIPEFERIKYYSADCDTSMKKVAEIENISLRAVLEGSLKEKLELQETIRHQESILESGNYLDYMELESYLKEKIISTFAMSQNAGIDNNDTYCGPRLRRSESRFQRSCSMPNAFRECKESNDISYCDKKQCVEDAAPRVFQCATETRNPVSVSGAVDGDKRQETLDRLESENVRLEQYIKRLLFMVLEGRPSVLESSKSISDN